ncbi:MAG: sulfate permease [Gammaproteobacteria bacterium]|jgi:SulP family sulfate permease|nr:sulfate permease [Gammaproteobacteria bacterium]
MPQLHTTLWRSWSARIWLQDYNSKSLQADLVAAMIVTMMLIPQGLAYAMLAGLPPETGLYASILPLVAYALLGSSHTLAVGPVAIISLLSANAVNMAQQQTGLDVMSLSMSLAMISGLLMLLMGIFKLGFIANLLSRPVITGFITAAGIVIAVGQLEHILGIDIAGSNLLTSSQAMLANIDNIHWPTAGIGCLAIGFLYWARKPLPNLLSHYCRPNMAHNISKIAPVSAAIIGILVVGKWQLDTLGVKVVGDIPAGLPGLQWPNLEPELIISLLPSALIISLIGYVESISVAQTLANKRRQQINPNHELLGLGAANAAAAMSGGFSVTGGFSRSVVNFDAGAATPMAGVFTAIGIAIASCWLTPLLALLPKAVLGATILVAVLSLIDPHEFSFTWKYSKQDFMAMIITLAIVLLVSIEAGVIAGVVASVVLMLWRTSRPHTAIVGPISGTEHFRNIDRHQVEQCDRIVALRIDESLFFGNVRYLDNQINQIVASNEKRLQHLILMASGINHIDSTALEKLLDFNRRLKDKGITMHMSEVKGPVLDRLQQVKFTGQLTGNIYLSQHQAWQALAVDHAPCCSSPDH